jgi:hypothetical protein
MVKHGPLVFEYSKITPYLFIGTNQCCQGHFEKELVKKGIRADISMEEDVLDTPLGVDYYFWLPTKDHKAPRQEQLKIGVKVLAAFEKQKIKTYIHCKRGHGRSPSLAAAFLISKGKTVKESLALIKKHRSTIHPNKSQIAALHKFKRNFVTSK